MRTKGCCSTGLAVCLALMVEVDTDDISLVLSKETYFRHVFAGSRSLSADSAAWDGTLELAVDAELGKLHAFLRTTVGQSKLPEVVKAKDCSWNGFSSFLRQCLLRLSGIVWIHAMLRPLRPKADPHPHPHQLGRLQRPAALDQWLTGAGAGRQ
ncbi:hypothetical protein V8C86DRAFT_2982714, partial [Haematococcus lacustris]